MFLLTWTFVLGALLLVRSLEFINKFHFARNAYPATLKNICGVVLDSIILSGLLYFAAVSVTDLRIDYVDFNNLGEVAGVSIVSFTYITYIRDLLLFAWPSSRKIELAEMSLATLKRNIKIYRIPFRLNRILYIPLLKIVVVGQTLEDVVPMNRLKLLSQSEIIFFRNSVYQRKILFITILLFFIPSLWFLKKEFPTTEQPTLTLFLLFFGVIYFLINRKLNKKAREKADLAVYKADPKEYCEALKNFRQYLACDLKKKISTGSQKNISCRILKLCK